MFDPVRTSASPSDGGNPVVSAAWTLPRIAPRDIPSTLRDASLVERPLLARDLVDGMDDAALGRLATDDAGRAALGAFDAALGDAAPTLDVSPQRARIATALRGDDPTEDTAAGNTAATTQTTAHIGDNTVTWTNDSQGRPIRAVADLTEVFDGIDRGSAETQAQRDAADRGIAGDQGGHLIGHRFVKDQGLKNLFPQNGNFNVSAYKTLENEWADWIDAGKDVHIDVKLTPADQDRPDTVSVSYEVTDPADGRVVYDQRVTFDNVAGQTYDRVPRADMADA